MLHITFSKYDCIIVHKAYYLFTCTCVSINLFHSHSHTYNDGLLSENVCSSEIFVDVVYCFELMCQVLCTSHTCIY